MKFAYPNDPLMAGAWASAISAAYGTPGIVAAFERDTGLVAPAPAKHAIDALIDSATGVHEERAHAFVDWFNENIWGEDPFEEVET